MSPEVNCTLDFQWHEETTSTSLLARQYLNSSGSQIPCAFAAATQTNGMGRLGRIWESPHGNVYLSIALPGDLVPAPLRPFLPFVAAVAAAQWIQQESGVRPTLKWPNDILIASAKIGGILCEATVIGQEWKGAIIGIGVNLAVAPQLNANNGYVAGRLTTTTINAETASRRLASFIMTQLRTSEPVELISQYSDFATAPGQLWRHRDGAWWQREPFASDGSLQLRSLKDQTLLSANSADHEFQLGTLCNSDLLVADIGNSRIKIAKCRRDKGTDIQVVSKLSVDPQRDTSVLTDFLSNALQAGIPPLIHLISVNDKHKRILVQIADTLGVQTRCLRRIPFQNTKTSYRRDSIGQDRLAAIEAARHLYHLDRTPIIIVSCGTATTIDFIKKDGLHCGGFIGIGMSTALKALHASTSRLPSIDSADLTKDWREIATTTEDAMSGAAHRMQTAWIEREIEEFALAEGVEPETIRVVVTGGDAKKVLALKSRTMDYNPDLILKGVAILAIGSA